MVIVHVVLDCSIVPQDQKKLIAAGTFWHDIFVMTFLSLCWIVLDCSIVPQDQKKLIAAGTFWHDIFRFLPKKQEEIIVRRARICITMT